MKLKFLLILLLALLFVACSESSQEDNNAQDIISNQEDNNTENITSNSYILHKNITATTFWVGEDANSSTNGNISNIPSAWDENWTINFGGVDEPNSRNGYCPANFIPKENPFYFALPYNDFDEN